MLFFVLFGFILGLTLVQPNPLMVFYGFDSYREVMLYVSSTLLLLVNAVTLRRVRNLFNRVAFLTLLYYGVIYYNNLNIILLGTWIDTYGGLFHLFKIDSFDLSLCMKGAILLLAVYYPRRSQKSMGAMGRKMSSFLLTQYTDSCLEIFLNNIIKMWEQFRFLEFALIILLILIEQIFLMSSSDLVSMLSTKAGLLVSKFGCDAVWLATIIPIKNYSNAEVEKKKILSENTINDKRYYSFIEWFRGFTDAESYFDIGLNRGNFTFKFGITLQDRKSVV